MIEPMAVVVVVAWVGFTAFFVGRASAKRSQAEIDKMMHEVIGQYVRDNDPSAKSPT